MTNPDELERAVERLELAAEEPSRNASFTLTADLRLILAANRKMREALEKIERWFGEFPETGRFWLSEDGTESDRPMSYGATWGSNGERDFMRAVARSALSTKED